MTKKERFLMYCRNRYKGKGVLIIKLKVKGTEGFEYIVIEDVVSKLNYYERTYNDDLQLISCSAISIEGYGICTEAIKELRHINLQ